MDNLDWCCVGPMKLLKLSLDFCNDHMWPCDLHNQSHSQASNASMKANIFNMCPRKGFKIANANNKLTHSFSIATKPKFGTYTPSTDILLAMVSMISYPPFRDAS